MFKVTFLYNDNIMCVVYVHATNTDDVETQIDPLLSMWISNNKNYTYEVEQQ